MTEPSVPRTDRKDGAIARDSRDLSPDRRRMEALDLLATASGRARTLDEVVASVATVLERVKEDVPFALVYLIKPDETGEVGSLSAALAVAVGLESGHGGVVPAVGLADPAAVWPLQGALNGELACPLLPALGPWPGGCQVARAMPLRGDREADAEGGGRCFGFLVAAQPPEIDLDDGHPAFLRLLCGHLTTALAHEELRTRFARMAQAAESALRAKDDFLAMLGHELRNPLSPILTALYLMRLRGAETRELVVIERQVGHLVRLVDDLLDVSRIAGGKIALRKARIELSVAVARALEIVSPLLDEKKQRLELQVLFEGLLVEADADRLAQVISNLLTNAAKYSNAGTRIWVTTSRAGDRARLSVRDEGIGIPPHMLDLIFERFIQQPQPLDRSKGGLGLGLAIVRSLVDLHGGTVSASSAGPGAGSEFVVELPLAPVGVVTAPLPAPASSIVRPKGVALDRTRVLVVDDNRDAADSVAEFLGELGYEVAVAYDGPSALTVADAFEPHTCVLDIGLPVMDGYELARLLRQADSPSARRARRLRLIALTGYGQESDRRRSEEAGFDAHLVKPLQIDELAKILTN